MISARQPSPPWREKLPIPTTPCPARCNHLSRIPMDPQHHPPSFRRVPQSPSPAQAHFETVQVAVSPNSCNPEKNFPLWVRWSHRYNRPIDQDDHGMNFSLHAPIRGRSVHTKRTQDPRGIASSSGTQHDADGAARLHLASSLSACVRAEASAPTMSVRQSPSGQRLSSGGSALVGGRVLRLCAS